MSTTVHPALAASIGDESFFNGQAMRIARAHEEHLGAPTKTKQRFVRQMSEMSLAQATKRVTAR